ncbi:N-acetyltransferase [Haploplasma axanthum]|uniref:Acetyltransferase (GNAT) family n=1 Tax=Haploplasma axanthum TaxID=29552 RepID=A0A449BE78_HAPAX|nr:GNAT family N-acetyltransferase [Haploplasma axanthum]VEU80736.1 Acetyltransferase (GNAT) family [Haploplasma axanthum]
MILIREVKTKRDARNFTEFPNKLYKDVPAFVPALSMDENNVFNKKKNPVHAYVESIRFLAYKNGKLVGRVAGLVNHKINYEMNKKQVRFTRLDMIDDLEVTKALISAVESWGVETYGMEEIIGPIGFTDFDRQGMLIEGFEYLNLFITIYNAPYYMVHMEKLGFEKDVDWLEKRLNWPQEIPEKVARATELIKKRYGYRLYKPTSKTDLDSFIYDAFEVYNNAFSELYGFYPMPKKIIDFYVKQVIGLVKLEWVWVVYDKNDKIAGFGVVMPSLSIANKKSNGKLFPFGWARILKSLKKYDTLDFYFIAVAPEHQGRGISALIFEDGIKTGVKHGVKWAETGPELENNIAIQSFWKDFDYVEHKKRRCWIKKI